MPLPPITNIEPEVVPAVDARNYDALYMTGLFSRLLNTGIQNMRIHFRPYDSAANEVKPEGDIIVEIEDVFVQAAACPAFAEAMAAVTLVGNLLAQQKQLSNKIEALEDGEEKTALQEQLDTLNTQIGTATLASLSA